MSTMTATTRMSGIPASGTPRSPTTTDFMTIRYTLRGKTSTVATALNPANLIMINPTGNTYGVS